MKRVEAILLGVATALFAAVASHLLHVPDLLGLCGAMLLGGASTVLLSRNQPPLNGALAGLAATLLMTLIMIAFILTTSESRPSIGSWLWELRLSYLVATVSGLLGGAFGGIVISRKEKGTTQPEDGQLSSETAVSDEVSVCRA